MTTLPDHLFVGVDGHLFDTRDADWSARAPLRPGYRAAPAMISTLKQVKGVLRAGPFTDLGGYPLYFITADGAALSFDAVREQFRQVVGDYLDGASTGWRVIATGVNFEDSDLRCDHTGKRIPAAYADDDDAED